MNIAIKDLLFDISLEIESDYHRACAVLISHANKYMIDICPYKVGARVQAYSLIGDQAVFIISKVIANDEESLSVILDPMQDSPIWKAVGIKEGSSDDTEPSHLCYLYGLDENEIKDVIKL